MGAFGRDAEGSRPGSTLEMQAYIVCWVELRPVARRMEIGSRLLPGRRGEGNIGWNDVQTRLEDSFSALFGA